ncbi:hypothetical protein HELRODRAFT_155850 [Helobdella robusta]|uniref:Phosphatidylinositol-4,5-bisphosphate 3-kinase n=1 Tax=Helobdella robusta TaxID=6412 RepID=T1ELN4_HELRO|nr:hypothetical protein HELRODRAFT_155850 [Helobdella robusta]ESO02630.1 hypothetical protein HELRODRAFT_155850 [Helobdella robusta]
MAPRPSSGELWGHHLMPAEVEVLFFMPNGMFISMRANRDASLQTIKSNLWKEVKMYPLYKKLMEPQCYVLVGVTQDAEREEFYDETRRLCDLRLFQPMFKLIEPAGNKEEKILNAKLNFLIGVSINEINDSKDLELLNFRRSIMQHCKSVIEERDSKGIEALALYHYPPNINPTLQLPAFLLDVVKRDLGRIIVTVWVDVHLSKSRSKTTIKVHYDSPVMSVISETVRRKVKLEKVLPEDMESVISSRAANSLLKVCGCDEYLLGNYPICQYAYVRQTLSTHSIPELMLVDKKSVYSTLTRHVVNMPSYIQKGLSQMESLKNQQPVSSWSLNKKFKVKVNHMTFVNAKEKGEYFIRAGLYHGSEALCEVRSTQPVESSEPKWKEWLEFDALLCDLPRSARLCLSLCCSISKKQKKKMVYAVFWCNVNLFDFNKQFMQGNMNICMWSLPPSHEELLYPLGTSGSNPSLDCPRIEIEFEKLVKSIPDLVSFLLIGHNSVKAIKSIIRKDILSELTEQEKELLWDLRRIPHSLPKLLQAVKWSCKDDVAITHSMLTSWPPIKVETALELLYWTYSDFEVRNLAIKCLEDRLTDCQLSYFLLQLVHVLEFEQVMDNGLVRFLLSRALTNKRIGQAFYWYLKASMQHSSKHLYYALVMEAYLRCCSNFVDILKQVEAVEKLTKLSEKLKTEKEDLQVKSLQTQLQSSDYIEVLSNFTSPLNCSYKLGELIVSQCDVKASKKRPLLLTWKNPDPMAQGTFQDFQIIFKMGDDLRQDMLTLQVFALMDSIWQQEGLDMRLTPYGCLATGLNAGLIEVVRKSRTVMQILNKDFRCSQLHNWIREKNKILITTTTTADAAAAATSATTITTYNANYTATISTTTSSNRCAYQEAIDTFTRSCAGYCVATFVLGVGDRHPSNIMVTESGQVFHIDFGHFLDHRKKKFGINRERVPFVLTEDFMRVIARGQDNPEKSAEFSNFMELCGKSFLSLRKHSNLIISLFAMMILSGIPELQTTEDLNYLRNTLKVGDIDSMALVYFQDRFNDAYGGSWTTKVDWFFHWVKNNNRV